MDLESGELKSNLCSDFFWLQELVRSTGQEAKLFLQVQL